MEGKNLHTSVVIELADQEGGDEEHSHKTDFDEMDIPKDYVIDQIFCGENITVYALFEIPEMKSKESDGELMDMPGSPIKDDLRFIPRNSFKRAVHKKSNSHRKKLSAMDCDDDAPILPTCTRNKSFYCLKHLGQNYEIPHREDPTTDLKVLFNKDFIPKPPKHTKFKAVSKGVNTDIAQSPKIIEDIQRAINMNFSCGVGDEKMMEIMKAPLTNSSCEVMDAEQQQSCSSFSSDAESVKFNKNPSPNFLFVPLLMMEERFMGQFQKDPKNQALPGERIMETKVQITPTKVSFGTNTEAVDCSPLTSENDEKRESQSHHASFESPKIENCEERKNEEKEIRNPATPLKKKDKDIILKEIRKLQGKLNSLIKSLEHNELSLTTDDDDNYSESEKKIADEVIQNIGETFNRRNRYKFDDIPIFSPLTFPSPAKKPDPKKKDTELPAKKENSLELLKSVSTGSLSHPKEISTIQSIYEVEKPKVKLKNVFSCLNIDWEVKAGKGVGPSKSVTSNRCNLSFPKHSCVKKSLSYDMRDDKIEMCCLKKIKNSSFKFEGGVKANMRIVQNGEVRLGENLTSLTREMGDEVKTQLRTPKTELENLNEDSLKEKVVFLKNGELDIKKSLNEEEGDAKLIYPNQDLISQKFPQNPEIHFCKPNTIVSDALLKSVKAASGRGKSKAVTKIEESGTKASSDTEKPTTPGRTIRRNNVMDSDSKKEVRPIRKSGVRSKTLEKKPERPETHEAVKPKSVSGSRKFTVKGTAESKLHVDKLIKSENEAKCDTLANSQKSGLTKPNADEKLPGRTDRLHRPSSQKRDLRGNPPEATVTDRRETEKKAAKKKSETVVEVESPTKRNSQDAEMKENVEQGETVKGVGRPGSTNESKKEVFPGSEQSPVENAAWLSSNSSSVVVELFSEKPSLGEEFYTEVSQDHGNNEAVESVGRKSSETANQVEKPIVKSVWALTKVLLYEDGTKKLEILEASLTPPGYSLKQADKKPAENILD